MSEFSGSNSGLPEEGPADWDLNELHGLTGEPEESSPEEIGTPEFIDVVMIAERLIKEANKMIEDANSQPYFESDKNKRIHEARTIIMVANAMIKHAQTLAGKGEQSKFTP